jgi:hypothetical protein
MGEVRGRSDMDIAQPIEIKLQYDPMTKIVSVDVDDDTSYAETLGIISFAQMLVMTDWQRLHAFVSQEEYDLDHYGEDDDD